MEVRLEGVGGGKHVQMTGVKVNGREKKKERKKML